MIIAGFQPISMNDYPDTLASICFSQGCPLRCVYCHNPELVLARKDSIISQEEAFLSYLQQRRDVLEGVVVSGGEPLMQQDIEVFLKKIKALGYRIKLDTSGMYPNKLHDVLQRELVDYVALDYKNVAERMDVTVGKETDLYKLCIQSLEVLRKSGIDYEVRTTIVKELHDQDTLRQMAMRLMDNETWYWQSFEYKQKIILDYMPDEKMSQLTAYTKNELKILLSKVQQQHKKILLR